MYSGSAEGLNQTSAFSLVGNESFSSIASPKLLDFNGDGFDDLVFSVLANQLGNASVFVHLGSQEGISNETLVGTFFFKFHEFWVSVARYG